MYSIDQLSRMTGLTARTLRNYLKSGVLQGSKDTGAWKFTENQVQDFTADPSVRPSIRSKAHAIVYDFLAGQNQSENEMCILLDRAVSREDAAAAAKFFCEAVNSLDHVQFHFSYEGGTAHFILKGSESEIQEIMNKLYTEDSPEDPIV